MQAPTEKPDKPRKTRRKRVKTVEEIKRQEYLTVPDAAQLGEFTRPQVYDFIKSGILPATRVPDRPNTLRVKRTDFEKFMEENRVTPERSELED